MANFVWDIIDFTGKFPLKRFNKKAFLKDIESAKQKQIYHLVFGSKKQSGKRHAHMYVRFLSSTAGSLMITFHNSGYDVEDEQAPYMEDCVRWIGQYFKVDKILCDIFSSFDFDETYSPTLAIPFPLITENRELAGSLVTGVNVELLKPNMINRVVIQTDKDSMFINVMGETSVRFESFDFDEELHKISELVLRFVKKKEKSNDSHNARRRKR